MRNMHSLVSELTLFPNGSFDLLDGLWYATRIMRKPSHTVEELNKEYVEEEVENNISWMGR